MKEQIIANLNQNHPWADNILWFDTIGSTNTEAKAMAQNGAPHGTVLIAGQQTGGRGRMGRSFCSPAGMGIYLSVILRPRCKAEELMHLTCATAVAMCDAVEDAFGFRPGVKWINDLIAKGKKLGGILTELAIDPRTGLAEYAIIGVGINCLQSREDFPSELQDIAISAKDVAGGTPKPCLLACAMIRQLEIMSRQLFTQKPEMMNRYKADCITLGQDIYLLQGDSKTACHALDLDENGGLIVCFPDGSRQTVSSGEVSIRPR